jgi:hypothetical protein
MKITGYKLQHAIRELDHSRDIASQQFNEGQWSFEGEDKIHPSEAMTTFFDVENRIAKIQTVQAEYNLKVMVEVQGTQMTLAEAVKRVGGAGRMEKMWRSCAKNTGRDRYGYRENTRDPNQLVAKRAVSVGEAAHWAKKAARWASALREAIQVGNATVLDLDVDPAIFG